MLSEKVCVLPDVGYQSIIIESDVKEVVQLCNSEDQDNSEISPICQEIRDMIEAFTSCSIVFVGREGNQAAHLCARHASSDRKRCIWINYNPAFLHDILRNDCNPID
jgi:hypothetical protein